MLCFAGIIAHLLDFYTKTKDGKLISLENLTDTEWWEEVAGTASKFGGFLLKVEGDKGVNVDNLSAFLVNANSNQGKNANYLLADLASRNSRYNKAKEVLNNFSDYAEYAETALALWNGFSGIYEGVDDYKNASDDSSRAIAVGSVMKNVLDLSSKATSHLPGLYGDIISTTLDLAAKELEVGIDIVSGYAERLRELDEEIENIIGDSEVNANAEEAEALNEIAEALSPFVNSNTRNTLNRLNSTYSEYQSAVNYYEFNKGVDINGDGKIGGEPYDPNDHGG